MPTLNNNKKSSNFSLSTISANGKVKLTRINVCPNNVNIIVAIGASVFVVKADAMHKLVHRGARLRGVTGRRQVDLVGSIVFIVTESHRITTKTMLIEKKKL
jgi:hypothetical protein